MTSDATACGYCYGYGREPSEGSRCQDCGGNGLRPGLTGYHPRAFSIRLGTICNGWQSADFDQLTAIIENAAAWAREAGVMLDQFSDTDRMRTRKLIERQILMGVELGHFENIGIGKDMVEVLRKDFESGGVAHLFKQGRPIL